MPGYRPLIRQNSLPSGSATTARFSPGSMKSLTALPPRGFDFSQRRQHVRHRQVYVYASLAGLLVWDLLEVD